MASPDDTGSKVGQFKPGREWAGNAAGRPKGSRNHLGEDFLKALHDDFKEAGVAAIKAARADDPMGYVKTIASLLPKEMNLSIDAPEMTDAELIERIKQLGAELGDALGAGAVHKTTGEAEPSKTVRPIRTH